MSAVQRQSNGFEWVSEAELSDLLDPRKGYIVRRGFVSCEEADRYREESRHFLLTTRRILKRIRRYYKHDYVWSPSGRIDYGVSNYRIYQSLRMRHTPETERIFQRVLTLRNSIEANWVHDDQYGKTRRVLYDYVQVTSYGRRSKGIEKHRDYNGNVRYPLLQPLVLLSQPAVDFHGGSLILHVRDGAPVNIQGSLKLDKGDLVLFDKSLYHEVEPTEPAAGLAVGRWTAVIGARYPAPPTIKSLTARAGARALSALKHVMPLFSPYRT